MSDPAQTLLERDDLIDGLRALVAELRRSNDAARIRIVGGAAVALTVDADRAATVDIDAPSEPADTVRAAAAVIAARRGWRIDWLNDAAAVFVPTGYGTRAATWQPVHDDGRIRIEIATPETLLAMKLHAAQRRGNRDAPDLAVLLPTCSITSTGQAAALYEDYYPGDSLTVRTEQLLDRLLASPTATPHVAPVPPLD